MGYVSMCVCVCVWVTNSYSTYRYKNAESVCICVRNRGTQNVGVHFQVCDCVCITDRHGVCEKKRLSVWYVKIKRHCAMETTEDYLGQHKSSTEIR